MVTHSPSSSPTERRSLLKLVAVTYLAVAVVIAIAVRLLDVKLPVVGHLGAAVVAVVLLYTPVLVAWRRREDLGEYGFNLAPLGKNLLLASACLAIVVPGFLVGYLVFHDLACEPDSILRPLTVPGACARYGGWDLQLPAIDFEVLIDAGELVLIQLVVVALPEELFFRGFLLHKLEKALPPKRRLLGGGVGWALVISSLLFALIHLPRYANPRGLATFFPGLLFGWLRSATGSILAPVLVHASSNILVVVVEKMVLR